MPDPEGSASIDGLSRKVRGVVLEGLFAKAMPQSPELLAALKQAGFDPSNIASEYTAMVFNACLEVARKHVYGSLPVAEGLQKMGVAQIEGIKATFIGKIIMPPLYLIGPERVVRRIPSLFKVDSTPAEITPIQIQPGSWRIEFRGDPTMVPDYIGGICKAIVELSGRSVTASARRRGAGDFDVELSWPG